MERKEDLTMTNKQMLVAQLRKEQEQNRILRIELEKLKAEVKQAQIDVLTELKKKYGFYICCSWCRATKLLGEIIDEFIEEIKK